MRQQICNPLRPYHNSQIAEVIKTEIFRIFTLKVLSRRLKMNSFEWYAVSTDSIKTPKTADSECNNKIIINKVGL